MQVRGRIKEDFLIHVQQMDRSKVMQGVCEGGMGKHDIGEQK